jgi:hypothetical protein
LSTGAHCGDCSPELFSATAALFAGGLPDGEVFSLLASLPHAMEITLDHRCQDYDPALLYLWREECCKGEVRTSELRPVTLDDFDVLPAETGKPVMTPEAAKADRLRESLSASAKL